MKPFYSFSKLTAFTKAFRYAISENSLYLCDSKGLLAVRAPDIDLVDRLKEAGCCVDQMDDSRRDYISKVIEPTAQTFAFQDTGIILPCNGHDYRVYKSIDGHDEFDCIQTNKLVDRKMTDIFSPTLINAEWDIKKPLILHGDTDGQNAAVICPFVVLNPSEDFKNAIRNIRFVAETFSFYAC